MPHHVFIVEDHPLMRQMMAMYITGLPDLCVCGSVPTAEDALDGLPGDADIVLVDISLPGMNGIDLIGAICARWPDLVCLVCSGHDEASYVVRALDAGARGYIAKGSPSELTEGLDYLCRGEPYLSPSLRDRVEGTDTAPKDHEASTRTD